MMSSQFVPYGMSHELLHLSSGLLTQAQPPVPDKARPSIESTTTGSETEKSDHSLLQRMCSAPSGEREPKSREALTHHDLNRQAPAETVSWAEQLCHTNFFSPCARHSSKVYRRCEVRDNAYIVDAAARTPPSAARARRGTILVNSQLCAVCSARTSAWTARTRAHCAAAAWLTTATVALFRYEQAHASIENRPCTLMACAQ
jgi:hypothetical protein